MFFSSRTVLGLSLGLAASTVTAQQSAIPLDIPPQSLAGALDTLSRQSGLHLFYADTLLQGKEAKALHGVYRPQEALKHLLADTGVDYTFTADNSAALKAAARPPASSKSETLAPVIVQGQTVFDSTDPYNKSYTVINSTTATKTDTPIMETPVSIQVVPKSVISDQKSSRITEALENVSGVRAQSSLGTSTGFIVRGFRNPLIYRNGLMAVPNTFRSEFDTANLESVEVLKGPASVLFGRSEPGGLINVTTKKPLDVPYYSLEQRFGSYDLYRTEWDATGPIAGNASVLYRLTGSYQNNASFRDFVTNDRVMINPSLTWRPSDKTDFTVNVEGVDQDYQANYGIPVIGTRPANIPISRSFGDPNDPIDSISKVQLGTELNHRFNDDWAIHNRFLASWGDGKETFLSAAPAFGNALDPTTGILQRNVFSQHYNNESYTTNLDLTGKFQVAGTTHEVLLGFDYLRAFTHYNVQGFWRTPNPAFDINIFNPSYGVDPNAFNTAAATVEASQIGLNFSTFKDEWYGLYFQDHITLWDKLHIMGGGRYDWIETGRGRGGSFSASDNALNNSTPTVIRKDDGFNPRVGILYQPWHWLSVYGNWTTSLGPNNGVSSANRPFKAQTGEQFEAGFKTAFFEQRLLATLAYYHLTRDNLLTPDLTTPDPNDRVAIGQQRSQGIELDITGRLSEQLSIISSYAFTDARITKDNRPLNGVTNGYEGKRLTNVPEHAGSLWLKYDFNGYEAPEGWSVGVGGILAGKREGDVENTFQLPGYVRMDAFAAYKLKVGPTRVTTAFNIRNLLDKTYYESTDPDANVSPRLGVYPGAPLMAMGSIRIEY